MKIIVFIFFLIFGQAMLAQKFNGFYLEPNVGTKINTNLKTRQEPTLNTQYFTMKSSQFIGPSSIFIGLNFGYTFKNNDKLQFGFCQDESIQGYDIYATSVTTFTPSILMGIVSSRGGFGGVAGTSFNLIYKRCVLNIKSNWFNADRCVKVHLNTGITYFYKPNNGIEQLSQGKGFSFIAPDSSKVSIAIAEYNVPMPFKRSFKFNLGIDFTFCKKDKEMFNLNVSFISNRVKKAYFSYTTILSEVENKNGIERYAYYIQGTGNGIYFTLSKRIYPFKWHYDRQQKKIEEYIKNKN